MISLKTGEWTTDYSGAEFRIITLDRCLHCQTAEAHAAEERTGEIKCMVCCKTVEIETRIEITVWAEEAAHNAKCALEFLSPPFNTNEMELKQIILWMLNQTLP